MRSKSLSTNPYTLLIPLDSARLAAPRPFFFPPQTIKTTSAETCPKKTEFSSGLSTRRNALGDVSSIMSSAKMLSAVTLLSIVDRFLLAKKVSQIWSEPRRIIPPSMDDLRGVGCDHELEAN